MPASTITTKGQVTIPKSIRDKLKINKGDKIEFIIDEDGNVIITPITTDVTLLKGIINKPKKKVSLEDMKNAIREKGAEL